MSIMAWLRKARIGRTLMAFVASVLLLVTTTACSGTLAAKNPRPEIPSTDVTSPYRGGMNDFSDVDPRARASEEAAEKKAEVLKENAERNVIDQSGSLTGNTKRILDKKAENAGDLGKNLQRNAEDVKDKSQEATGDLSKQAKRSLEDLKDSTLGKGRALKEGVEGTAEDVKRSVRANTPDADDLRRSARGVSEKVAESTEAAGKDLVGRTEETGNKTATTVQDKLNQAVEGAKRTVENAGDAIKDAVD